MMASRGVTTYYNRITFLLLQYFVKCCRQTSIAKALSKSSRQYSKTSLPLRKEVTTSKLVSSFCDSLCNFLHFAHGSSAQLHTHLAKWVLTNHLQYCNLIGLHSSVQQYKSYISVSPGHPLGTGTGLRPAISVWPYIQR